MSTSEVIRFLVLRSIGNFLVLFALFGVGATFGPDIYYEIRFHVMEARGVHFTVTAPEEIKSSGEIMPSPIPESGFASLLSMPKDQILIAKDTVFSILIPKIAANAKVIPNVDPSDEKTFLPLLQQGVAHAKGSVFPGIPGTTYLFAHSTDNFWDVGRYNAVFYLLKNLQVGDDVIIFFQDRRYNYTVSESKIVDPGEVSYLTKSQESEEKLVLQTCWPPGTTWKRLLVFAKPK